MTDLLGATHALYGDCSQTPPSTEIYIGETLATDAQMIAITAKATELQASYDSQSYARNRQYPPLGDQLDDLYHAGVFSAEMTAKLKKVKDDNPK
jgi:hypothetical protein